MSVQGLVLDIDGFSTHDGPGIRTTVFLKGCPLSCKWCHSPESQLGKPELLYRTTRCSGCLSCVGACPAKAISPNRAAETGIIIDRKKCGHCFTCVGVCDYKALQVSGILTDADKLAERFTADLPFFESSGGGVTVSGGEPLMQPEFTAALMKACKERGIQTLLETCGFGGGAALKEIARYCDLIYFDIKILDSLKHREWTGVPNAVIKKNLEMLCAENHTEKITVRVPCIPGVNDAPEDIADIAGYITRLDIRKIQLLPYNPMAGEKYGWIGSGYALAGRSPRDKDYYARLEEIAEQKMGGKNN